MPLDEELRARMLDLSAEHGERAACRLLQVAGQTFARAAGGLPVLAGTQALTASASTRSSA